MEDVGTSFPGRVIDYVESGIFPQEESTAIWNDNVLNWLGK